MTRFRTLGLVSVALLLLSTPAVMSADVQPADVCLEVAPGVLSQAEWSALAKPIDQALESRASMFPAPSRIDVAPRMDIWAGHDGSAPGPGATCLESGSEWSARFDRAFLESSAEQMLADAPTTPGIGSSVAIEWYPDEARLRTTLVFAGPLDIPNGTCWVDDALTIDGDAGLVVASGEQGLKTSLFAEGACGRFFDHLPDGGAGEQVVTLLPAQVTAAAGGVLRFVAEEVRLSDEAIIVAGSFARD